jgi:hypothetical protein
MLVDFRGSGATNSSWAIFWNAANSTLNVYNGPTDTTIVFSFLNPGIVAGTAFYWAVQRRGGVMELYVNNEQQAAVVYAPPATNALGVRIGADNFGLDNFNGLIDSVVIARGVCFHDAVAIVPSHPRCDFAP